MATEYTETLDTILKDTIPQLPGVVRAVAERELRLAMREFFERSYAWRILATGIDVPAGDNAVQITDVLTGDTNADVVAVLHVVYNGRPLAPLSSRPPATNHTSDNPTHFYMSSNADEIKLYPFLQNASTGLMDVHVACTPKMDATQFIRQTQTKFYDALVEGFLARMYAHPNKPYSAPMVAGAMRHNFRRKIGYYMAQAKQGYNDAPAWSYPGGWKPQRVNEGV